MILTAALILTNQDKVIQARLLDTFPQYSNCLLYTSDAADERSSVDLGGRRIIKKKKNVELSERAVNQNNK